MRTRVTRQDVAAAAGVSGATVSRVYNTPQIVDPATVLKVRETASKLGFVPDKHASALRRKSSGVLLFLEIEEEEGYHWPQLRAYQSFYGDIIRALIHRIQKTPFTFQLLTINSPNQIADLPKRLDFGGIVGFDIDRPEIAAALAQLRVPVVCGHHTDHISEVSTVSTDNRAGGRLVALELKRRQRKRPVYVTGLTNEVRSHKLRWDGFAEEWGEPMESLTDGLGFQNGYRVGQSLAARVRAAEIDSIVAVNDLTALGVSQGLRSMNVDMHSVTLCGYDNLPLVDTMAPSLVTIEAYLPDIYVRAVETLIDLMGGKVQEPRHLVVKPTLVTSPAS